MDPPGASSSNVTLFFEPPFALLLERGFSLVPHALRVHHAHGVHRGDVTFRVPRAPVPGQVQTPPVRQIVLDHGVNAPPRPFAEHC